MEALQGGMWGAIIKSAFRLKGVLHAGSAGCFSLKSYCMTVWCIKYEKQIEAESRVKSVYDECGAH